ncbi:MAG: SDR family NAD(P)-dependent oxidoreductase, partial [Phycisphaerae bacterium]|nr:SDR family NAD(P)-dependent oxidoreductase [Phycisphaerae bacterium]
AEAAAKRGAKVVLAARSGEALEQISQRLNEEGGQTIAVTADVSDRTQVEKIAQAALQHFGRIDTWVNNAGLSIYGRLVEVKEEDSRRLFDINFWGVVHGSLVALPHLLKQGGALINVGSEVSEAVVPLQAMYSASKHAVKGFTDGLRIEVQEADKSPISITLIQPTAVDTPFPQHARNYMSEEPKLPTPMIEAEKVAAAILDAAENPTHHTKVGMMAKINTMVANNAPKLAEKMAKGYVNRQQYDERPRNPDGTLNQASEKTNVVAQTAGTGGREKS